MDTSGINRTPIQIAPSRTFQEGVKAKAGIVEETARIMKAPGDKLNLVTGHRLTENRAQYEKPTPHVGVHMQPDGTATATDVPNPDSPDGKWDPTTYMPRFVFDKAEDALPVSPTFDGDTNLDNNAAPTQDGPKGNYQDGVIGGDQKLSSGFAVTKKGDYTVLTYSFYYAHNKAGDYHRNDYSTAQVYLKPGPDGKLAPEYLMTSWHHGEVLTPWKDLKKDEDGRPIVGVNLGSHALEVRDEIPAEGLSIKGNGQAMLNGKPIDQSLSFETFQKNVNGARYLDPSQDEAKPRLRAMTWGAAPFDPFLPEVFHAQPGAVGQVLQRGKAEVEKEVSRLVDKADNALDDAIDKLKEGVSTVVDKAGDVADGAKDVLVDSAKGAKGLVKSALNLF